MTFQDLIDAYTLGEVTHVHSDVQDVFAICSANGSTTSYDCTLTHMYIMASSEAYHTVHCNGPDV